MWTTTQDSYDVVVVGGGAAGLSAALTLARARRRVLVVDGGEPRNARAGHVHGYLGREGASPASLLASGRAEVAGYGGHVVTGSVVAVQPVVRPGGPAPGQPWFCVVLTDGSQVEARRVLLTTGLVDELPDVPGLAERWGREVLHCPYCHGWEVRDRALVVLATTDAAVEEALLFRQWSDAVTLVRHGRVELDDEALERLAARGVDVVDGPVRAAEVVDDRLVGLRLVDGRLLACDAVVVQPLVSARADVLDTLGLQPTAQVADGHLVDRHLEADGAGATAVAGVWAAGNVTDPGAQVMTAAAAGLHTAAAINVDLVEEDVAGAVAQRRRERLAG